MTVQSKLKLRPVGDRLLVRRVKQGERISGGIVLPDLSKEKQEKGCILAIGEGKRDKDGKLVPLSFKVGECIIWDKFSGNEVKHEEEEDLVILKADDVIAIIEEVEE